MLGEAVDAVLDGKAPVGQLVRDRHCGRDQWDDLCADARDAGSELERQPRANAGHQASI